MTEISRSSSAAWIRAEWHFSFYRPPPALSELPVPWQAHPLIGPMCLWLKSLGWKVPVRSVTCASVIEILACKRPLSWCILLRQGVCSPQRKLLFARHYLNTEADRRVRSPWTYPRAALGQTSSQLACKFLSKWSPQTEVKGIPAKMCHLLACFTFCTTSVDYLCSCHDQNIRVGFLDISAWFLTCVSQKHEIPLSSLIVNYVYLHIYNSVKAVVWEEERAV